jgi:hypothetical protein
LRHHCSRRAGAGVELLGALGNEFQAAVSHSATGCTAQIASSGPPNDGSRG